MISKRAKPPCHAWPAGRAALLAFCLICFLFFNGIVITTGAGPRFAACMCFRAHSVLQDIFKFVIRRAKNHHRMSSRRSSKRKADSNKAANRPQQNSSLEEDCTASSESPTTGPTDETNKGLREQAASFSEDCVCSITHGLMVDPVLAEDGNTYERSAILEWLKTNNKSPLNPSQTLHPDRLFSNRAVLGFIEKLFISEI